MSSATRELLAGRYHLEERIATGGMGVVWRARDEYLGRDVAIKLIRPEYADDPTFRQRLRQEARAIAAIRSPHVVRIHDVCEASDPEGGYRAFLIMELVAGGPLSRTLAEGSLTIAQTTSIVQQAASALAAAHEQQIVHRDIKPANIMVDAAGWVTVLDFGIARAADAVALTATDLVLGTARYIAPEQAEGRGAGAASDVYSLGVVAYQCLAGRVPFDGDSDVALALARLREPPAPLPASLPDPLRHLVMEMLAKEPARRPTAKEVMTGLASPSSPPSRLDPPVAEADAARSTSLLTTQLLVILAALGTMMLLATLLVSTAVKGEPRAAADPSRTQQTTSPSPATARVAAAKVSLDPTRFIGRPWPDVRHALKALGLHPVKQTVSGGGPSGTVIAVAPIGKVAKDTSIAVVVSRAVAAPRPGPPRPAGGPGPGHVPPGHAKRHHGG